MRLLAPLLSQRFVLALALCAASTVLLACTPPALEGRPCQNGADCVDGWVCAPSGGICLELRSCDDVTPCDAPLVCVASSCALSEASGNDGGLANGLADDGGVLQTSPCADRLHRGVDCQQGCAPSQLLYNATYDPGSRRGVWMCGHKNTVQPTVLQADGVEVRAAPQSGTVYRQVLSGGRFSVR